MLYRIYQFILARPKQNYIALLVIFILTFSGSTISRSLHINEPKPPEQPSSFAVTIPYTKLAVQSLYLDSRYQAIELVVRLNYELDQQEAYESLSLIEKADRVKNTSPFRKGTSSKNSSNRYHEWMKSDRKVEAGTPRYYALSKFASYDWGVEPHWGCLDRLWWHESNWNYKAGNPGAAYGIPQSAPGSKMGSSGGDWKTNPETQIDWGLDYINKRYGNPCAAFKFWKREAEYGEKGYGWY
jgi:hypothetical protein